MATEYNLRPVEALYLLHREGVEDMEGKDKVAAVLSYLAENGYIAPAPYGNAYQLTEKGKYERRSLRPYEQQTLESISMFDTEGLKSNILSFDFQDYLADAGFFARERKAKGWWVFKKEYEEYVPTDKYNRAVDELKSMKQKIVSGTSLEEKVGSECYAFPSSRWNKRKPSAPQNKSPEPQNSTFDDFLDDYLILSLCMDYSHHDDAHSSDLGHSHDIIDHHDAGIDGGGDFFDIFDD